MRPIRAAGMACVALAALSTPAWAQEVNWSVEGRNGRAVSVSLPAAQARQVKSLVEKLRATGAKHYVNFWKTTSSVPSRTYPNTNGVSLVAAVGRENGAAGREQIGKKSIGLMCQGTPLEPHQTGEVRIGDLYFPYYTVNGGGRPQPMEQYLGSWSSHCEMTIPVSDAELAAFKVFYLARANQAIVDRNGQPIRPQFDSNGATQYCRGAAEGNAEGWVEGCSAASSSSLHPVWTANMRRSIPNIQAMGRQLGIPEMANATPEMAALIEGLAGRLGIKQQASPQGMVRRGVYGGKERVGMITILNDENSLGLPSLPKNLKWDFSYGDDNREAWSGMAPVTIPPDLQDSSRPARTFSNVRLDDSATLDRLFSQVH